MFGLMKKLWFDDRGALLTAEYLFLATILVIGIVVAFANLRDALTNEFSELSNAFMSLSQGYAYSGMVGCSSSTMGGETVDGPETFDPDHSGVVTVADVNAIPCD